MTILLILFRKQYTTNQNKFYTSRKLTIWIFISSSSPGSLTTMKRVGACEDRRRAVETHYFALLQRKIRRHCARLLWGFFATKVQKGYHIPVVCYTLWKAPQYWERNTTFRKLHFFMEKKPLIDARKSNWADATTFPYNAIFYRQPVKVTRDRWDMTVFIWITYQPGSSVWYILELI